MLRASKSAHVPLPHSCTDWGEEVEGQLAESREPRARNSPEVVCRTAAAVVL